MVDGVGLASALVQHEGFRSRLVTRSSLVDPALSDNDMLYIVQSTIELLLLHAARDAMQLLL